MAKADFVSSLVFFVLGVYMISEGLGMPGATGFIEEGGEPGRVPVILGAILAICATVLLVRSVTQGGYRMKAGREVTETERRGYIRTALTACGCSFYAVGLLGEGFTGWRLPYELATFLFLFAFIVGFEWEEAPELGAVRWAWAREKLPSVARMLGGLSGLLGEGRGPYAWLIFNTLVQSVIVTWTVSYLFEKEFYVMLP